MIYFDANYVVRCYLDEHGAAEVRALASAEEVACVEIGQVEASAAFHRKMREGAITPAKYAVLARQFEADLRDGWFMWLPLTPDLLAKARATFTALPPTVFLRTADALHLVCAREAGFREVHTNDRHMLAAAPHFGMQGLNVIPPSGH